MINAFLQKSKRALIGVVLGSVVGGLYYYFVGCESGNCAITSNPYISIPYGGLLGYLFAGMFEKKQISKSEVNENS